MPKQLNISLGFSADTSQARQQIQQLKQSLQELNSGTIKNNAFTKMSEDIVKAQQSVQKLSSILDSSLNANTGRLDLSKFNQQLGSAGMSIQSLATDMNALGASGQKAFLNLANTIVSTQKPMLETNKLLDGMWTALRNTARWQLSSSLLHGFMGAIQGAYGYAQDLDKSLTNIAIVTGRSREEMASFAEQANKSAQALSASTTAYTDAALIYYQQGLDDAQVKARTDVTMMLSNVTGQSAEQISSYMTAIWNNFDDGSKSMEYYADVITALGAATASSSEEIARGMQQFAAVADTVGLSYEYAATALATIVAQTRQSESTVGNGLRTIFARFDSVKLGDTLEDGVGLTKYTEALEKVGVSVLNQNGELKEMDEILDAIGEKWETLNKTQQTALAQTVGGVRQYTNLMALFDNWDTFQENLSVAQGAEGSLEEQSERFEESWLGAQRRVKAAWQAIYDDLINSDFFIGLLDGFAKVLKALDTFIDSVGGIPGVLSVIGVAITGLFGDKILGGIQAAQQQLKVMTGVAKQESDYIVAETKASLDKLVPYGSEDSADAMRVQGLKDQVDLNHQLKTAVDELAVSNKHLTDQQIKHLNSLVETTQQYSEAAAKAREYQEEASLNAAKARSNLRNKLLDSGIDPDDSADYAELLSGQYKDNISEIAKIKDAKEANEAIDKLTSSIYKYRDGVKVTAKDVNDFIRTQVELEKRNGSVNNTIKNYATQLDATKIQIEAEKRAVQDNISIQEARKQVIQENIDKVQETLSTLETKKEKTEEDTKAIEENKAALESLNNMMSQTNNAPTQNFNTGIYSAEFAQNLTNIVTMISRITMAFNSLKSAWDAIQDPNLSSWEKFTRVITSLGMALPILFKTFSQGKETILSLGDGIKSLAVKILAKTAATTADTASETANAAATAADAAAKTAEAGAAGAAATANMSLGAALKIVTLESLKFLATPMGVALLAIAAAIGAVVIGLKAIHDASPEAALEVANQSFDEASQKAQEASDSYDELKSSLDEYKQAKEDINNIKDSDERKKAINEENDKILEMLHNIENWHDLIGDLKYDSNGLIALTDEQIKALENDKAREASLARQLKLQEEINVNTAEQAVEDSKYSGKKINVTTQGTPNLRPDDPNYIAPQGKDMTSEMADFFAKTGLGVSSDPKVIEAALNAAGYDPQLIPQILSGIEAIANDEESLKQFNEIQANHLQTMAENDALEKQQNQEKIDQAQSEIGDKFSIDDLSAFGDIRARIAEEWNALDEATKQAILASEDAEAALQEAIKNRINIEEANNVALQESMQERAAQRKTNINSMANDLSENGSGHSENYWKNAMSDLNAEEVQFTMQLNLDEIASKEELLAAIEKLKQETEEDRRFQIAFKNAEENGIDMDEWSKYVDYLQSINEEFAENKGLAAEVATANMRLNKGVESLIDDFGDWRKNIDAANESGDEWAKHNIDYAESMTGIQQALADIANTDIGNIRALGEDFILENMDLIQEAAYGDADAIDELIKKIAEVNLMKITPEIETDTFEADRQALIDAIYETNFNEIEIGSNLDAAPFYDELLKMVNAGEIGANDINQALANIGYTPIVEEMVIPSSAVDTMVSTSTGEVQWTDPDGNTHTIAADKATVESYAQEDGSIKIPIIKGSNGGGGAAQIATSNNIASALASSNFTGGTGRNLSPSNRNSGAANRPKGSSGCFAAGTLVTVDNHYENIENVKIGDIVLSYNEKTKKNEFSEVVQTMIHFVHEKIYNLFIKNDKLVVTGNHKFLITHNGVQEWKQAADIEIGDLVLLANGTLCEISNINIETKFLTVYNFEVSNTHNYYVGKNQILAHNKGKSGGGGSGKEREKKKEKDLEEKKKEEDRYHDLEEAIEDVDTALDRLDKSKDRAFGKDKINFMNLEIKKFKEQIGLTKKYIDEIKKYQKVDRDALEQKLKDIGMSQAEIAKQFDANGVLTSYEDLFSKIQDHFNNTALADLNKAREEYNAKVREWNAGGLDEDSWKEVENNLKEAEEVYKKQEKIYQEQLDSLKQYEETTNLLQEKQQELIDQMNDLFDKALDIAREKIEIQLDVNDRDLKHLQWLYENIGDDADRVADRIANLSKQAEISVKNIKTNADGIRDIFSGLPEAYNGKDGKKLIDFSGINLGLDISNPEALINTVNQVVAKMREVNAEAGIKTFLNDITKYEDGLMEEYRNLSDINKQITENMRDAFNDWRDLLEKNLDTNDHMQDLLQSYQDIAELLGQENMGISDEEMQQWRKSQLEIQRDAAEISKANWEAAKIARQKAKEEYDAAVASGNQLAIAQAKAMLEEAEDFEKDAHKEYLERVKETLRTAEEIYQQSLKNNEKAYQKALSGGIAPTLDRLQEQLDMQKELNHLHLDDYEKYKKLGDLQANINKQLANNPNVKVQGKLKGLLDDVNEKMAAGAEISEGEATILEKRLQLLQAEDQLMAARNAKSAVRMTRDNEGNFSYTYTADTSKIEEAQQNYADKFYDLLDYERKYSEDTQAAILQSYKEFLDKRNDIINDETLTNAEKEALLNQLEKDLQAKVQFYTDEMKMVTDEMGRLKDEDWADMQQTLGRLLAEDDDFETSFEDTTLAKIAPAWNSAADAMKAFTVAAGQLKADDLQAIADLVNINEASMQNVGTSTLEFGKQLTDVYAQLEEKSDDAKEAAKEMAEETIPKYTEMINKGKEFSEKYGEYFTNVANNIDKVVTAIEKLRKSLAGIEDVGDVTAIFADALGESPEKNTSGQQFDTGGYTGSWGRSGKLAILHQKELVLNEKDTKNILEAVDILRSISGLNSNINVNNNIDYSGLANLGTDSLQQQVHIDASFPNVQSHNEIELALNNLINSASQYVNRKN